VQGPRENPGVRWFQIPAASVAKCEIENGNSISASPQELRKVSQE
jgi:hypothetical protein